MTTAPPPAAHGNTGRRPATRAWLRALEVTAAISRNPSRILPTVIDELADRSADAPALLSEHETFTFAARHAPASTLAGRWRKACKHGDRVCLIMPNRPEYMAAWLGVTRVGGVAALVNTHLRGESLAQLLALTSRAISSWQPSSRMRCTRRSLTLRPPRRFGRMVPAPPGLRASIRCSTACRPAGFE
jgi:fatty-acyl-CoA synthase